MVSRLQAVFQVGILTALITLSLADNVTVELRDGTIQGFTSEQDGKVINNFYGIPYAEPPLGSLRFKPPQPPIPWTGVRDASVKGHSCMQQDWGWNNGRQPSSEDCLFINVHAPSNVSEGSPLPVMVWVYGGSYRGGAGDLYDGSILAAKDVIVVTFNYRLDVIGFLSTEDETMPGNYASLDQVEALKWVNDNIDAFGGDPQKVTVFGESAGSSSVSLLVMSPLTKGLFTGAIMESGVSLSSWAYAHPARSVSHAQAAQLIAEIVACNGTKEQLECFQSVDAQALLDAAQTVSDTYYVSDILMNPRVESTYGFLPDLAVNLLTKGDYNHVNTIRGFNQNEYAAIANFNVLENTATIDDVLALIGYEMVQVTIEGEDEIADDVIEYYLADVDLNDTLAVAQALERFGTNSFFVGAIINEVNLAFKTSEGEKNYLYQFATKPEYSRNPDWITAGHADEIAYVFGYVLDSTDPKQRNVSETVITMWTNFAKTGNPNYSDDVTDDATEVEWEPYDTGSQDMLSFRIDGAELIQYDENQIVEDYFEFLKKINTPIGPSSSASEITFVTAKYRTIFLYTLLAILASIFSLSRARW